jgi:hypothetical protein
MAMEQNDFRATEHVEPYWTNSAFGGMPTYQLGLNILTIILVQSMMCCVSCHVLDYLFLYFLGFYGLLLVLKVDPLKASWSISTGFFNLSYYYIGCIMQSACDCIHNGDSWFYFGVPKKYILGGLITLFATALEINANHFQMTYYLLIFLLLLSGYYIYIDLKRKNISRC